MSVLLPRYFGVESNSEILINLQKLKQQKGEEDIHPLYLANYKIFPGDLNSQYKVGDFFLNHHQQFKQVTDQDMNNLDREISQCFGCDFNTFMERTRMESEFKPTDQIWKDLKDSLASPEYILKEYTSYYYAKKNLMKNNSIRNEQASELNPSNNVVSGKSVKQEKESDLSNSVDVDSICQTYFGMKRSKFEPIITEYLGNSSKKVTPKEFTGIASDNFKLILDKIIERDVQIFDVYRHIQHVKNELVAMNSSKVPSNIYSNPNDPTTYLESIFGFMQKQAQRQVSVENKIESMENKIESVENEIKDIKQQNKQIITLLERLQRTNYSTSTSYYSGYETPAECSKCRKLGDSNEELTAQLKKEQLLNKKLGEEKAELAQKVELLLQQKRTEELTKKGDIMNSNSSKKLEEIKKVIAQYSNNCISFIDSLNIEDNYIADVFEHFIRYSISSAFCLKTDLPEIIMKATETFKHHAPFIQNYLELAFELIRKEITSIYQVMEGADNFKLGWFEKSQNLEKDYEIKGDVKLTDSSSTFFTCMYPSILFGEKCFVIGNATKVHP